MGHETIGHYEVVRMIGEGGIGRVFLARDTVLDRQVALKILSSPSPDGDDVARFEREAKALAALDHPNILSIHEFGRIGTTPYVVMELLDGQNLRELLKDGPIPQRTAVVYALEIAQGLAAAHAKGIFHRDLKPENIFVTSEGRVKIVDFGLANTRIKDETTATAEAMTLTSPGTVLGTVGYMSPEQVRGERTDHRSDLFAFGAVLYEMLTGKRPFDEETVVETLHAVLKKDPPMWHLEHAGVPAALVDVVSRCMEKSPVHRFQSARDISAALQEVPASAGWTNTPRTFRMTPSQANAGRRTSIAVLPFTNIGSDADMEYFSDGVTEDIINALTQVNGLFVAARTSCFAFKGKSAAIAEIGAALRVNTVLEGSVRRSGNRLRITAQLIDVADGYHLWSERYDRELDDVFAIQDDIAVNIAQKLRIALKENADAPLLKPGTRNLEAYELYLKARYLVEQRGEGLVRGLEFFNQAIAVDPDYALAYAELAETLCLLGFYSIADHRQVLPRAKVAARKALELDDTLAEAHNAMAMIYMFLDWDWNRAQAGFDRALEINPTVSSSRFWKALFCLMFVRGQKEDALREALRAVDLDPMAPIPAYALGNVLICSGRYEAAVTCAETVLARDPTHALIYRILGIARLLLGQYDEASTALEMGARLSMRHPWFVGDLGIVEAAKGNRIGAERLQDELRARSQRTFVSPLAMAIIPTALGDLDQAVQYVEEAFEQRDPLLMAMAAWPPLENLRNDPRVRARLEQMGISWA